MYIHIFIGTYILSEGLEYPSKIFWEIFWYKKFCGKINRDQLIISSRRAREPNAPAPSAHCAPSTHAPFALLPGTGGERLL